MATEDRPEWVKHRSSGGVYRLEWPSAAKDDVIIVNFLGIDGKYATTKRCFSEVRRYLASGQWSQCERPADAIAPKYGLNAEEKQDKPEWVRHKLGDIYRLVWPVDGDEVTLHYAATNTYAVGHERRKVRQVVGFLQSKIWTPCERPDDAIAPNYGLVAEEKPLRPEWIIDGDGITARVCWDETHDFDGKKFVPVIIASENCGAKYSVGIIESYLQTGAWRAIERPENAVGTAYGMKEEALANTEDTPFMRMMSLERKLARSERKHAELLTIVEALLAKHDPEMLASIRKSHGSASPDKP